MNHWVFGSDHLVVLSFAVFGFYMFLPPKRDLKSCVFLLQPSLGYPPIDSPWKPGNCKSCWMAVQVQAIDFLVLLKVICYFHSFLGAF